MKLVQFICWFAIAIYACDIHAQTNLNPPLSYEPSETGFETVESDLFLQSGSNLPIAEPAILGLNRNGETEYSVLENKSLAIGNFQNKPASQTLDVNLSRTQNPAFESSSNIDQLLTNIILAHLPHQYTQDKKWGQQSKRWAGVKLRRDNGDGKLETKRRYKMVNHGTWQKYRTYLNDPNKKFSVRLIDVDQNRDGETSLEILFLADLNLEARQTKWVKGIQLYSLSAEGNANVGLSVNCDVGMKMDFEKFPPDLILSPVVTKAKINLESFKLDKVSKVGGEVAQQVTRFARKELESRIAEKEKKLVKKLNREIDENRDKLRLSISDAIQLKWFDKTRDHLPDEIKEAIAGNTTQIQPSSWGNDRNAAAEAKYK